MDFFQNTCFKGRNNMAVEKNPRVTTSFYKNNVSYVSHIIKTFIDASCTNNIHTEEKVFAVATFEDL